MAASPSTAVYLLAQDAVGVASHWKSVTRHVVSNDPGSEPVVPTGEHCKILYTSKKRLTDTKLTLSMSKCHHVIVTGDCHCHW